MPPRAAPALASVAPGGGAPEVQASGAPSSN